MTSANVHDSQVLADLVDDDDHVLYADSAYCGETVFSVLPEGLEIQVHRLLYRGQGKQTRHDRPYLLRRAGY